MTALQTNTAPEQFHRQIEAAGKSCMGALVLARRCTHYHSTSSAAKTATPKPRPPLLLTLEETSRFTGLSIKQIDAKLNPLDPAYDKEFPQLLLANDDRPVGFLVSKVANWLDLQITRKNDLMGVPRD